MEDFPVEAYERVAQIVAAKYSNHELFTHHAGAWNALAYRFHGAIFSGDSFASSLKASGSSPPPEVRYGQEQDLFYMFSNGFSAFEATFYGLYAIGAFLDPASFPLAEARQQQQVSPNKTAHIYTEAFKDDPILGEFTSLFADSAYLEWREIRNILTHRTAPGRLLYVSIGGEDAPPAQWKLNNIQLDEAMVPTFRKDLSRLVTSLVTATAAFAETHL